MSDEAKRAVHEAAKQFVDEGEIVTSWTMVAEVARPDGNHLIYRSGGGFDGTDSPMHWAVIGMLRSSAVVAEQELIDDTSEADE